MLFNIDIDSRAPETGDLLVVEPFMRDENFSHSVILLIDYSAADGAMGIVMNNQINYTLSELINTFSRKVEIPVYCGGPLSRDRLYSLHTLGEIIPESRAVGKGLFLGSDFDAMTQYVNSGYPTEDRAPIFHWLQRMEPRTAGAGDSGAYVGCDGPTLCALAPHRSRRPLLAKKGSRSRRRLPGVALPSPQSPGQMTPALNFCRI